MASRAFDLPDGSLDELVSTAARLCDLPIAFVQVLDGDGRRTLAAVGVTETELAGDDALLRRVLENRDVTVVADADHGPLRFIAAAPLPTVAQGATGALFVADRQPACVDERRLESLRILAGHLARAIAAPRRLAHLLETRVSQAADDGIGAMQSDWASGQVTLSPTAQRLAGISTTTTSRTETIQRLFASEDANLSMDKLAHNAVTVLQSRVVPADGSVRWLEVRIFVQPRAGTQPLAHIVLLDLTERRLLASLADELADRREAQAEARGEERLLEARLVERARLAAVTENRRRLQAIIDGAPAAIFGRDRDGKFLFANQTCQRILGWPPADGADPLSERERRVMDSGETISEELSLRPAGAAADATFLVQRFPLRDATGTIYCVCAIATDITASRAMEAERRTRVGQQHLISALATQLAEGLAEPALVAAATRSACVGLEAKGAAVYRAGPGADVELVGQHALTADARTAAAEIAAAAIRTAGAPTTRHAVALMVPGIIEPATVLVVLVEAGQRLDESDRFFLEEVVRLLAIARARRHAAELEQQLIRAQRMESVGKLAGGVAHDFNNLLAVIMNYGAFVSEALEERDADVRADVAEILRAAERAAELTRSLLLFGGAGAVSDERCDPNQVVQALVETFRRTLGADVKTVVSLQPGVDHVALAAADLKELVVALATNACEAMPAGGTLSIQTGATPDGTRLVVGDDGEGMSADVLDRALEPFFTTRPPGKGKGLGLATVHGLAGRAGGKVQLSSTVGTGTTVTLDLPGIGRVAGAAPARAALPLGAATVLLVEDEPGVRDVVRRILESGGYRVLAAAGPAEARSIAATEEFDLLLTDVVMPGESGPDLAATLPGGPGSSALLFMSGYAEEVFDRRGGLPTGLRLVEKPFTRQVLLDAVAAAIADHRRAVT